MVAQLMPRLQWPTPKCISLRQQYGAVDNRITWLNCKCERKRTLKNALDAQGRHWNSAPFFHRSFLWWFIRLHCVHRPILNDGNAEFRVNKCLLPLLWLPTWNRTILSFAVAYRIRDATPFHAQQFAEHFPIIHELFWPIIQFHRRPLRL